MTSATATACSPMRQRIVAACERFEDLKGQKNLAIAKRIRDLKIDILIDAKGATDGTLNCAGYGSSVTVTATFGLVAAGEALRLLRLPPPSPSPP